MEAQSRLFVPVRVDSDAREDLVRLWDVRDLPALIWFSPDGGVLARAVEIPRDGAVVVEHMKKAIEWMTRVQKLERGVMKEPDNVKRLKSLAEAYYSIQLWNKSADMFDRLIAKGQPEQVEPAREFRVYVDLMRGKFLDGLAGAEAFEKDYPASQDLAKVAYWRGLLLYRLGRLPEAVAVWEDLLKRFPDDAQAKLAKEAVQRAQKKMK